jgi:hypothetical protein
MEDLSRPPASTATFHGGFVTTASIPAADHGRIPESSLVSEMRTPARAALWRVLRSRSASMSPATTRLSGQARAVSIAIVPSPQNGSATVAV